MKLVLYLNGKKVTKKYIIEKIGKTRLDAMIKESKETFMQDPYIRNDYYLGSLGMLTIVFQ